MSIFQNNINVLGGVLRGSKNSKLCIGSDHMGVYDNNSLVTSLNSKQLTIVNNTESLAPTLEVENDVIKMSIDTFLINSIRNEPIVSIDDQSIFMKNESIIIESTDIIIRGDLRIQGGIFAENNFKTSSNFEIIKKEHFEILNITQNKTLYFDDSFDSNHDVLIRFNSPDTFLEINFVCSHDMSGRIRLIFPYKMIIPHQTSGVHFYLTGPGQTLTLYFYKDNLYIKNVGCEQLFD
jgi:hypothetical protein